MVTCWTRLNNKPRLHSSILKKNDHKESNEEMSAVCSEEGLQYETFKRRKREFKCGLSSLWDDPKEGNPSTATETVMMAN